MLVGLEVKRSNDVLERNEINLLVQDPLHVFKVNFLRNYGIDLGLVCLPVECLCHALLVRFFR